LMRKFSMVASSQTRAQDYPEFTIAACAGSLCGSRAM
jgi:hypothetical protein